MSVTPISPSEQGFYAKKIDYAGIPIKASAVVADRCLFEAWDRLHMMLRKIPMVLANLVTERAELHIIGKEQVTSDLPEHRHLKGKPFDGDKDVDEGTRGLGGLLSLCGEENLLRLENDRYYGRDICVHEFAHTIRHYGLDADCRKKIASQYKRSVEHGLWNGCYGATNDDEFFAELSMWYFGTHGDLGDLQPIPADGPEWLRSYDPSAFQLIDDIYAGRVAIAAKSYTDLACLSPDNECWLKSIHSKIPTRFRFENRTSERINVYWLNYEGQRIHCGRMPPHGFYARETFATHPWLLTDRLDRALAIFVAESEAGVGILRVDSLIADDSSLLL